MWRKALLAIGFTVLAGTWLSGSPALAKGPYGLTKIGNWHGGAYTHSTTGAFTACTMAAQYRNGVELLVTHGADGLWRLGFANKTLRLQPKETFPLDVTLDGAAPVHLFASAAGPIVFSALIPNNKIVEELHKANLMVVQTRGATLQFRLEQINEVIPAIQKCVARAKTTHLSEANIGDWAPPPVPTTLPPAANGPTATPTVGTPMHPASPFDAGRTVQQSSSGFIVSGDGHLVTNNHVVAGCVGEIRGSLPGQPPVTLRLVAQDAINDLALLQAPGSYKDTAKIRGSGVRAGDGIVAVGYPLHGMLTSDVTVTTGIVNSLSGVANDTRFLQISAPVQHGNSGGPLLDTTGSLVGVVTAKINALKFAKATGDLPENINFAIKTAVLRNFLDSSSITYQTTDQAAELRTPDIVQGARGYTMLISCTAKPTQ